jgi:hypothetical protein
VIVAAACLPGTGVSRSGIAIGSERGAGGEGLVAEFGQNMAGLPDDLAGFG